VDGPYEFLFVRIGHTKDQLGGRTHITCVQHGTGAVNNKEDQVDGLAARGGKRGLVETRDWFQRIWKTSGQGGDLGGGALAEDPPSTRGESP